MRMEINQSLQELLSKFTSSSLNDDSFASDKDIVQAIKFITNISEEQMFEGNRLPLIIDLTRKLLSFTVRRMSQQRKHINRMEKEMRTLRKVLQLHQTTFQSSLHNSLQCNLCPKRFFDQSFLEAHTKKRHPETGLDAVTSTPLINKLSQLTSSLNLDRDFDRLAEQLNFLTEKMEETERQLEREREARSSLTNVLVSRVEGLEDNLTNKLISLQEHDDQSVKSRTSSPVSESGSISPAIQKVMMKQYEEVQKISRDVSHVKKKLEVNRPETVPKQQVESVQTQTVTVPTKQEPQTPNISADDIRSLIQKQLSKLGINQSDKGLDQDRYAAAIDVLKKDWKLQKSVEDVSAINKDTIAKINPPDTLSPAKVVQKDDKSHTLTARVKSAEGKTESKQATKTKDKTKPIEKDQQASPTKTTPDERRERLSGILKSSSLDKLDKKERRISFSEKRIEISPEHSEESAEEIEEDSLKWTGEEIEVSEEEADRASPVPTPKPRASVIKGMNVVMDL